MKPESDTCTVPLTKKPLSEFQILLFTPQFAKPPAPGGGEEFENNTSGESVMRTDFLPNILWILVFRALFLLGTNAGTAMRQLPPRILPLANRS